MPLNTSDSGGGENPVSQPCEAPHRPYLYSRPLGVSERPLSALMPKNWHKNTHLLERWVDFSARLLITFASERNHLSICWAAAFGCRPFGFYLAGGKSIRKHNGSQR